MKSTENKKLILQKYINGIQISSESVKFKDKIYTILSNRNYKQAKKFYPSIIENGGDIPLNISKTNKKKIDSLISKISKILKIKDSPLKCDLILKKGKIYVLEATPRFGGGYVASHSSEAIYGVNFLLLYIKILLGIKINKINFKYKNNFLSIRFIFNKKSKLLKKINKINLQKFKKNIVHKVITNKPSSFNDIIKSHADRKGCVLVKSNHRKDAIKIAEKITNSYNREVR
jgi:predicted ATP-grasp superfamily ATP-dependent carboligase